MSRIFARFTFALAVAVALLTAAAPAQAQETTISGELRRCSERAGPVRRAEQSEIYCLFGRARVGR